MDVFALANKTMGPTDEGWLNARLFHDDNSK